MKDFWLAFVPLFVAVDAVGSLPLFIGLTERLTPARRRVVVYQSMVTALVVAFSFLFVGHKALRLMGVSIQDFLIAGGSLLFVLALVELSSTDHRRRPPMDEETLGAVPIGVPLIVGPAVLTTSLLLIDTLGPWQTGAALAANILLAGVILLSCDWTMRLLGAAGSRVVSKLASLILAALGVMLVRRGLTELLTKGVTF